MSATPKPTITTAGLRRLCCNSRDGDAQVSTSKAHWELYLVVYNSAEPWPAHAWPISRRHKVPTIAERTEALAKLGYAPAPDSEWEWTEGTTPVYHGHPTAVSLFAGISIVPLEQAPAAAGGDA
ncbi:DUF6303 family protein [Streptomyces sp. NPDC057596]|uniref:DUF6303 family protein n=1 Tax=Streptomyces sp. NPDC057596 TaxID=3346178 RepID=UPI003674FC20